MLHINSSNPFYCCKLLAMLISRCNFAKPVFLIIFEKLPLRSGCRAAHRQSFTLCVCVCFCVFPSLMWNGNPCRSETSVREKYVLNQKIRPWISQILSIFLRFSSVFPRFPSPKLKKIQTLVDFYRFLIVLLGCISIKSYFVSNCGFDLFPSGSKPDCLKRISLMFGDDTTPRGAVSLQKRDMTLLAFRHLKKNTNLN